MSALDRIALGLGYAVLVTGGSALTLILSAGLIDHALKALQVHRALLAFIWNRSEREAAVRTAMEWDEARRARAQNNDETPEG